jgi:hypothetical protein
MNIRVWLSMATLALCLGATLAAHHSWTADYDGGKPIRTPTSTST